jgi:hypothetical protein
MRGGLLSLSALVLSGCAFLNGSTESPQLTSSPELIEAPAEEVWLALPAAYAALGLEITGADESTHLLTSTRAVNVWLPVIGPKQAPHARCVVPALIRTVSAVSGTRSVSSDHVPVRVPSGRLIMTLESRLLPHDEGTQVETRMILSAVSFAATARPEEPYCVSTGRLEAQIARGLRRHLSAAHS